MTGPKAHPVPKKRTQSSAQNKLAATAPRAFAPPPKAPEPETFQETSAPSVEAIVPPRRTNWPLRILLGAFGFLFSLGLALTAERLVADLFSRYEILGWVGLGALALGAIGLVWFILREIAAIMRLRGLDRLRATTQAALTNSDLPKAKHVTNDLSALYAARPDLAAARTALDKNRAQIIDADDLILTTERNLMQPLDARARTLTATSARRVTLVTAVSPRALVDIAFVTYESIKLTRAIAELYGARPGLLGAWRLSGAVLGHLAVTGGIALGDSVLQQLIGHGLAAKLSARLGEGVVNGLMTVRIGIAAMKVTRPMPFTAQPEPKVMDFVPELTKLGDTKE